MPCPIAAQASDADQLPWSSAQQCSLLGFRIKFTSLACQEAVLLYQR